MNKKKIIALVGLVLWVVGVILLAISLGGDNMALTMVGVVLCFFYGFLPTLKIVLNTWKKTIGGTVRGSRGFAGKLLGFFIAVVVGGLVGAAIGVVICPFISIYFSILALKSKA